MKRLLLPLVLSVSFLPCFALASLFGDDPQPAICSAGASFRTAFSPSSEVAAQVVQEISNARKSIRVVARRFWSKRISEALFQAGREGRDVRIVVDKSQNSDGYSAVWLPVRMGFPPHVLPGDADLRLSYIVIDDSEIILGDVAALPDVESEKKSPVGALIIHNAPELAKAYEADFDTLWTGSVALQKK